MRLLVITQAVDEGHPVLGFFCRWLEEFAKRCEKLTVICLQKGEYDLPAHVKVFSLGKESLKIGNWKLKIGRRWLHLFRFYRLIWSLRRQYDSVFVHMNQEYVLLAGWWWRLGGKRISLWYVHRQVGLKLRLAEKLSNVIFTSTPESFRLRSRKVKYVGHGVDIERFRLAAKDLNRPTSLVYVGRITRIKRLEVIISAAGDLPLTLVGEPITDDDQSYKRELTALVARLGRQVRWLGFLPNFQLPRIYNEASFSVNAAPDGGMDKAVLESLACGCPVFAANRAFREVFAEWSEIFLFKYGDADDLAVKIKKFYRLPERTQAVRTLVQRVTDEYSVEAVVGKIIPQLRRL